jgi:hypothetical protein
MSETVKVVVFAPVNSVDKVRQAIFLLAVLVDLDRLRTQIPM